MGRRRRRGRAAVQPGGNGAPVEQRMGEEEEKTPSAPPRRGPQEDVPALRLRLLALIRGFYLDAITRLPTADLRDTLARGLLVGGHCFGPLHPAHNIIANSVWYAAAFPLRPADRTEMHALGAQETDRAARRSLDGLVACLLHICPFLSPVDALWQLSRSRADLRVAVASVQCAKPSLLQAVEPEVVNAAFQVAAEAARHPNPAAFALFAFSVLPGVERDVSRLLVSKGELSCLDTDRLSSLLLPYPLPNELCRSPPDPSPKIIEHISAKKRNLTNWYKYMLGMTDAALCKFTRQTGLHYELHTIYGENLLDDEDYNQYFHINFIAQPKEDHSSSSALGSGRRLFFFAEAPRPATQHFREEDISMCCLVAPSPGDTDNCNACLQTKHKLYHTVADTHHVLSFGGQCYEIGTVDHDWRFRPALAVDYLCFDPDRDNALVEHLHNHFARIDAFCSNRKNNNEK